MDLTSRQAKSVNFRDGLGRRAFAYDTDSDSETRPRTSGPGLLRDCRSRGDRGFEETPAMQHTHSVRYYPL